MTPRCICSVAIATIVACCPLTCQQAQAQDPVVLEAPIFLEWDVGEGDYALPANWFNPEGVGGPPNVDFQEIGVIFNGGTAVVSSPVAIEAGGVVLGELADETGNLRIEDGGELSIVGLFVDELGIKTSLNVGATLGGTGILTVEGGGRLDTFGLYSNADPNNVITLGGSGVGGAGGGADATLNAAEATLRGTTRIVGSDVDFSTNGPLSLLSTHTLVAEFDGVNIAPVKSTGQASLGGTLDAQFSAPPAVGDRWTIVDADKIAFGFDDIISNQELGPGQALAVRVSPGGNLGQVAELIVEQRLEVNVDWGSGDVSIVNRGDTPVEFDGYRINSPNGNLLPVNWASLDGNPDTPGWDAVAPPGGNPDGDYNRNGQTDTPDYNVWRDTFGSDTDLDADGNGDGMINAPDYNVWRDNFGAVGGAPNATVLTELNPLETVSLAAADGPLSIGNLFNTAPVDFGGDFGDREDLTFSYTTPSGDTTAAVVSYVGDRPPATLELIVDPDSGQAELRNPTSSVVETDAYEILSASGSLDAIAALASIVRQQLALAAGVSAPLGQLFAVGAEQDLTMSFSIVPGSGLPPGIVAGLVLYESLASGTATQAVPEPVSQWLLWMAMAHLLILRRDAR